MPKEAEGEELRVPVVLGDAGKEHALDVVRRVRHHDVDDCRACFVEQQ